MSTFSALAGALSGTGKTGEAVAAGAAKAREAITDGSWEAAYRLWKAKEGVLGTWRNRNIPEIPSEIDSHIPEICRRVDVIRNPAQAVKNAAAFHAARAAVKHSRESPAAAAAGSGGEAAAAGPRASRNSWLRGIIPKGKPKASCPHCGDSGIKRQQSRNARGRFTSAAAEAAAEAAAAETAVPSPIVYNERARRYRSENGRFQSAMTAEAEAEAAARAGAAFRASEAASPAATAATASPASLPRRITRSLGKLLGKPEPRSRNTLRRRRN
jgi:hypothetical protein